MIKGSRRSKHRQLEGLRRRDDMKRDGHSYDAVVVGAGVIGLAAAWEIVRDGGSVALVDRDAPGAQATRVAAGMLAPVAEAAYGEERLLGLTLASAAAYPGFVAALEAATGTEVGHMSCGALHVALDRDEAAELRRRRDFLTGLGFEVEWLGPSACRDLEPGLAPGFHGGIRIADEAAIDPRLLTEALVEAATGSEPEGAVRPAGEAHADLFRDEVRELVVDGAGNAAGVRLADGQTIGGGSVVVATGAWGGAAAAWLPPDQRPPVRPVKGQILELGPRHGVGDRAGEPIANGIVATERVYLVPRADGRLVVGATVEEQGFDTAVTAGGIFELLREGYRALPDLAEMELIEATAGPRPASPDNVPLIGPDPRLPGLVHASGHYRNGILLAPLTGRAVADAVAGRPLEGALAAADPSRFAEVAA